MISQVNILLVIYMMKIFYLEGEKIFIPIFSRKFSHKKFDMFSLLSEENDDE